MAEHRTKISSSKWFVQKQREKSVRLCSDPGRGIRRPVSACGSPGRSQGSMAFFAARARLRVVGVEHSAGTLGCRVSGA